MGVKGKLHSILTGKGASKEIRLASVTIDKNENVRTSYKKISHKLAGTSDWKIEGGKVPQKVKDVLPVKLSKHCKLVGAINYRARVRSDLYEQSPTAMGRYARLRFPKGCDIPDNLGESVFSYNKVVFGGGWNTNWVYLNDMSKNWERPTFSDADIRRAVKARWAIDLKLPYIKYAPRKAWLRRVEVKPHTFSGALSSLLFGRTRERAASYTIPLANRLWKRLEKGMILDTSLYAIGGKSKPQKIDPDDTNPTPVKTRLILMVEDHVNRICGAFLQPLTKLNGILDTGSIMIARSLRGGNYRKIYRNLTQHLLRSKQSDRRYYNFSSDFSGFDVSVNSLYLKHATAILRTCFPTSVFVDRLFVYLYSSMAYKNVLLPNGYVVRIKGGIATGHPATSWIGSIVSWIVYSCCICLVYEWDQGLIDRTYLHVMGDDVRGALPYDDRLVNFDKTMELSGLKASSINDSLCLLTCINDEDGVPFLKQIFRYEGGVGWVHSSMLENLFSCKKPPPKDALEEAIAWIGYIQASPLDWRLYGFISTLVKDLLRTSAFSDVSTVGRLRRPDLQVNSDDVLQEMLVKFREDMFLNSNKQTDELFNDAYWAIHDSVDFNYVRNYQFYSSGDSQLMLPLLAVDCV